MPTQAPWPWWHQYTGPDDYRVRELLRAIWDLHAMYSSNEAPWVWRGQPNAAHDLTPGIHTRLGATLDESTVVDATQDLISTARTVGVDRHEGIRLPDMALLALLQHHGAATPLLDVSLDPLIAMYMATVSPNPEDDTKDGVVFAIKRPQRSTCQPMDSRPFEAVYASVPAATASIYRGPDVSDRLRIQRGHFLLGHVKTTGSFRTTIPVKIENPGDDLQRTWIWRRMNGRGERGLVRATTDVAVFRVAAGLKATLRRVLEDRSGLTTSFVYPTAWHQPHLDEFCRAHGRTSPL